MEKSGSAQLGFQESNSNRTTQSKGKTGDLTSKQLQATQTTKDQAKKRPTSQELAKAQKRIEEDEKKRAKENQKTQRAEEKQLEKERKKKEDYSRHFYDLDNIPPAFDRGNGMGTGCP